jgi:hypothetical protein
MGLVTWGVREAAESLFPGDSLIGQIATLALPTLAGVASYLLLASVLKVEEMRFVKGLLLRRRESESA